MQFLGWDCAYKTLAWTRADINFSAFSKILAVIQEDILPRYKRLAGLMVAPELESPSALTRISAMLVILREIRYIAAAAKKLTADFTSMVKIIGCATKDVLGEGVKTSSVKVSARLSLLSGYLAEVDAALGCSESPGLRVVVEKQSGGGPAFGAHGSGGGPGPTPHNIKSAEVSKILLLRYGPRTELIQADRKNLLCFGGITVEKLTQEYMAKRGPEKGMAKGAKYRIRKKHALAQLGQINTLFGLGLNDEILSTPDIADSFLQCFYLAMKEQLLIEPVLRLLRRGVARHQVV